MAQYYNENLELITISSLVQNAMLVYPIIGDILEKNSFGWKPFGILYKTIREIVESDLSPDYISILAELERKDILDSINIMSNGLRGKEAIDYMLALPVDIDNVETYAYQVQDLHGSRQLISLNEKIKRMIDDGKRPIEILSFVDLETGKISAFVGAKNGSLRTSKDVTQSSHQQFKDAVGGKARFISTRINAWDDYTNGLYPQRLYMVAAATNDGKSALVENIAYNLAVVPEEGDKVKVCIFSFEMSSEDVVNRFVQIATGISPLRIERGELSEDELVPYETAMKRIAGSPIIYDDSSEMVLAILRTKIRKAVVGEGARVVIIDQLEQLSIGGGGDNQPEYIRFNYMSYRIKAFARELDVPIVLVHQMNRSADSGQNRGKDVDPQSQDLAQAGEKACDAILIIRHKKSGQEVKETNFNWVKNRQGKRGKRRVEFVGKNILFRDLPNNSEFPDFMDAGE